MNVNLLVLISDEHRRDAMGCMGHGIVRTPCLDALAARGTLFTNAYTPSPMCVPARAALAAGTHVHRTGCWDSATAFDGRIESWMHRTTGAGMPVTAIGKLHFRSAEDDTGFCDQILPMHVVDGIGWPVALLRDDPPVYEAAAELAADVGRGESSYTAYDRAITAAAETWIAERAGQTAPWAAFVSLVSPHYPLTAPAAFHDLYDPAVIPDPVAYDLKDRPDHPELRNLADFFDYDRHFDPDHMRRAKAAYFGLTSFLDAQIGRILAALETSGQAENTVVIYASDHGEMLGDHGFWTKQVMYEASAGVPMIVAGPGVPAAARVHTAVSLLDIGATAEEIAGLAPSPDRPGQSLRRIATAPDDPDRTVLSEYHDGGSRTGAFMIRWGDWKYIHYADAPPQLFHLGHDPDERHDRAKDAAHDPVAAAAIAEGAARLRKICDPEAENARAFADQAARIAELGGVDACRAAAVFNHTPAPGTDHP